MACHPDTSTSSVVEGRERGFARVHRKAARPAHHASTTLSMTPGLEFKEMKGTQLYPSSGWPVTLSPVEGRERGLARVHRKAARPAHHASTGLSMTPGLEFEK